MRSKLFVSGSRPDLFAAAVASQADAVSFDLEGAAADELKASARADVAAFLRTGARADGKLFIVRINAYDSPFCDEDMDAVVREGLDVVNVPKAEDPDQIRVLAERLDHLERERGLPARIGLLATVETPRGVRLAAAIAAADPRVVGLQIGFGDLFEPLGISRAEGGAADAVRLAVRLAAAEAGRPAFDGAYSGADDPDIFRRECEAARRFGLSGKSCMHESQIPAANDVFRGTQGRIARADRVGAAPGGMPAVGSGAVLGRAR